MGRTFTVRTATRERVPLLVGIAGASGSGKTFSALRLATGMQRVTGGDVVFIDTEARRALHYADRFKFRHIEFAAPFSPLDYLEVIEFAVKNGAGVLVIDSLSHEHEGPGGVLEWHDREMGGDFKKQMLAWAKPKAARRRLINSIVQLGVNAVFCFRAKEKIKLPKRGDSDREPKDMGWMPIAGEEFVYEMTAHCLLYPGSGGMPTWNPDLPGEKAMCKKPVQFRELFEKSEPLSEEIGESLARWAAGDAKAPTAEELRTVLGQVAACATLQEVNVLTEANRPRAWTPEQKGEIRAAIESRRALIKGAAAAEGTGTESPTEPESSPKAAAKADVCGECQRHITFGHAPSCSQKGKASE